MSIPLVRNNTKDAINTSIIAIKKNLERINSLLGLADSSEPDLSGLATKQELEDAVTEINNTIDEVETSLQPVDTVQSGNMNPVTSNAVAIADNYDYQYYRAEEQTCFEIDIPFTADNSSPNGTILINERNGSSYLFVFNTIISDTSTRNYVGKVTVLRGNIRERLLSELRWDIDSNNNVIKFYLRKGSIANARFLFKVLQVYPRNTNITFNAYASSENWDNAQYSSPFTVVVGTTGTITTGMNGVPFSGYVTSSSTKMYFLIPMFLNGEETITVNEMTVVARSVTGQYIEAAFNVGFDALSSPYTLTITKFPKIGIFIGIEKTSAFVYNGTSTNVLNNSPVAVTPKMDISIS